MVKNLNEYINIYKNLLIQGDVKVAYVALRKFMMTLKTFFNNEISSGFTFGNVYPGYMDYTYFYFVNEYMRSKKLRFGVVLNHRDIRFELWLMGQNERIQSNYWKILENSQWNNGRKIRPEYSVLEAIIIENPDFNDLELLSAEIVKKTFCLSDEILLFLKKI